MNHMFLFFFLYETHKRLGFWKECRHIIQVFRILYNYIIFLRIYFICPLFSFRHAASGSYRNVPRYSATIWNGWRWWIPEDRIQFNQQHQQHYYSHQHHSDGFTTMMMRRGGRSILYYGRKSALISIFYANAVAVLMWCRLFVNMMVVIVGNRSRNISFVLSK